MRMKNEKIGTLNPGAAKLLRKQKGKCGICGDYFFPTDRTEVDHIKPIKLGGKTMESNRQLVHHHCHINKTKEDLKEINKAMREKGETT